MTASFSSGSGEGRTQLRPVREPQAVAGLELDVFQQKRRHVGRSHGAKIAGHTDTAAAEGRASLLDAASGVFV
jgi:hypothetical protein